VRPSASPLRGESAVEPREQRQERRLLGDEPLAERAALRVALRGESAVEPREQPLADRFEVRAGGDRDEVLPPDRPAAALHPSLVVPRPRSRERRLEGVVRDQRLHPRRQHAGRPDQHPRDRRPQIIVEEPVRHAAHMSERADVPVEETHLVLPRVEPAEVSPARHQPHDEQPRLLSHGGDVDPDLEEVDLPQVPRLVHERNEDLLPPALPLGHVRFHQRGADRMPLLDEEPVQPRGRQPLLALRPARRLRQQRIEPRLHATEHRPDPDDLLA